MPFTEPTVGVRTGDIVLARPPGARPPPARPAHHHPGEPLPHAHLRGPGHACATSRPSSSTRSTPWRRPSAAPTSCCRWSGSTSCASGRRSASGCRPRSGPSTRSPASSAATRRPASPARSPSSMPASASRSSSRSSSPSRTWAISARCSTSRPAARPPAGRPARASGPRSTPASSQEVLAHRSTIIFCNARRLAERMAARLNELAENEGIDAGATGDLVKAHHGSLAREQRVVIEDQLKRGELRGLVATSSLELGHRHGRRRPRHPGGVTGRGQPRPAAHRPGRPLGGRAQPRASSSPSTGATCWRRRSSRSGCATASSRRPATSATRSTCWPSRSWPSPSMEEWSPSTSWPPWCGAARATPTSPTTCSTPCSTCWPVATPARSSASCGPASCGTASAGRVRARDGAKRLAVTSGGTIPDRGLFGVFLPDGTRVGELDEEMVYESRPGETFLLGRQHVADRGHHLRAGRGDAGAGPAGEDAVLARRPPGPPARARPGPGSVRPRHQVAGAGGGRRAADDRALARRLGGQQRHRLPRRAGRGRRRGARRPHRGGRALPRRDRRLAGLRPLAVRHAGPRPVGDGDRATAHATATAWPSRRCGATTAS